MDLFGGCGAQNICIVCLLAGLALPTLLNMRLLVMIEKPHHMCWLMELTAASHIEEITEDLSIFKSYLDFRKSQNILYQPILHLNVL